MSPPTLKIKKILPEQVFNGPTSAGFTKDLFQAYKLLDVSSGMSAVTNYDEYRISAIKLTFYPPVQVIDDPAKDPGHFYWIVDYDDASDTAGFVNIQQHPDVKHRRLTGKPFSVFFRPRISIEAFDPTANTPLPTASPAVIGKPKTWLDTANKGVSHYGFKAVWSPNTLLSQVMVYRTVYYLEFRHMVHQ